MARTHERALGTGHQYFIFGAKNFLFRDSAMTLLIFRTFKRKSSQSDSVGQFVTLWATFLAKTVLLESLTLVQNWVT